MIVIKTNPDQSRSDFNW